jgi:hypothetical protein
MKAISMRRSVRRLLGTVLLGGTVLFTQVSATDAATFTYPAYHYDRGAICMRLAGTRIGPRRARPRSVATSSRRWTT